MPPAARPRRVAAAVVALLAGLPILLTASSGLALPPGQHGTDPVSVGGISAVVLGHRADIGELQRLAPEVDDAVRRVTAVWGPDWPQHVEVVVPAGEREFAARARTGADLSRLAAVAVGGADRPEQVIVQPANLARLSATGRQVVLTHEVLHVASRPATGPLTPIWLSEGLADYVGYLGVDQPAAVSAAELRADVRAGRVPAALPTAAQFQAADGHQVASAYEQAWLAVGYLVATCGLDRVLALYRELGARTAGDPAGALEELLRSLGTSTAALTTGWQAALRERLA